MFILWSSNNTGRQLASGASWPPTATSAVRLPAYQYRSCGALCPSWSRYQLILLGGQRHMHVKQLAQGCYVVAHRPGSNPRPSDHEAGALPLSHHAMPSRHSVSMQRFPSARKMPATIPPHAVISSLPTTCCYCCTACTMLSSRSMLLTIVARRELESSF